MHKTALFLLLLLILLTGCNLPRPQIESTPTVDLVATTVSQLRTQAPTPTQPLPTVGPVPSSTPLPPTATLPPNASPTPQAATATLVPTLDPNDPKSNLGAPTWTDTLSSGKAFYQYESDNTRVKLQDGALLLTGITANGWHGWSLTHSQQPLNSYIEALFTTQTCSGSDLYGLTFRATDTAGYFFGVTCDGRYNLHARNFEDGADQSLMDLTQNPAIKTGSGQSNRLGVLVEGDRITLYANGAALAEVSDTTFKEKGYFGAFVAANETPEFTVKMDEISLWKLP